MESENSDFDESEPSPYDEHSPEETGYPQSVASLTTQQTHKSKHPKR